MSRLRRLFRALGVTLILIPGIAGCVVYETTPGVYSTTPGTSFDRSWSAALGALADEGVQIVALDRGAGAIRGHLGDIAVAADVRQQADGSVRVEFGVSGNTAANPGLKDRIVGGYHRRMGR